MVFSSDSIKQVKQVNACWVNTKLTLFRMGGRGGGQKGPPTSFSPVTSTNVGISPQNFLTFSFYPFATLA